MPDISAEQRTEILEKLHDALRRLYVFPDVAEKTVEYLKAQADAGVYDAHTTTAAFASQLTTDLQATTHDKHMAVMHNPDVFAQIIASKGDPDDTSGQDAWVADTRYANYHFKKVERLIGNIGYIKLDMFVDAGFAAETAIAALQFVANCDAVIFDLRENGGGAPSMVQLISSYLFDEPKHLNSFYWRPTDSHQQFWTQAHVQGKKLVDTPIYVLTSSSTFSAAEEFTYNLKNMERATIVGETTGGGAHPGGGEILAHDFVVWMSQGRAINPITETNWEGTGIEPHISTSRSEALQTAHLHALESLLESATDDKVRANIEWELMTTRAMYQPVDTSTLNLAEYAGTYGNMQIIEADGHLLLKDRFDTRPIVALSATVFMDSLFDDRRLEFVSDNGISVKIFWRGRANVEEFSRAE